MTFSFSTAGFDNTFSGFDLDFNSFESPINLGSTNFDGFNSSSFNLPSINYTNTNFDWGNFWDFGKMDPNVGFGVVGVKSVSGFDPQFGDLRTNIFGKDWGPLNLTGFGTDSVNGFDLAKAPLPSTTVKGFGDVFKGIFELPSILSIGKGLLQGAATAAAYKNAAAESGLRNAAANQEYWARYADAVAQNYRDYQVQLDTYYRDLDYAQRRRDYEDQLAKQQAEYKGAVGTQAFKNFERQIADLEGRFYEEEAKETIEMENIRIQSIAAASKAKAKGQVGRSIERINNQYHQQYLANLSNREITRNYRIADKIRQAEALDVARENASNQVQFYTPQPIPDPVKPLAPLPITAVPPTPEAGPSSPALAFNLIDIADQALKNYQSMQPPAPKPAA